MEWSAAKTFVGSLSDISSHKLFRQMFLCGQIIIKWKFMFQICAWQNVHRTVGSYVVHKWKILGTFPQIILTNLTIDCFSQGLRFANSHRYNGVKFVWISLKKKSSFYTPFRFSTFQYYNFLFEFELLFSICFWME
jgi:hypothetical protein